MDQNGGKIILTAKEKDGDVVFTIASGYQNIAAIGYFVSSLAANVACRSCGPGKMPVDFVKDFFHKCVDNGIDDVMEQIDALE